MARRDLHSKRGPDGNQRLSVELLMGQLVEQASLIMTAQRGCRSRSMAWQAIAAQGLGVLS